MKCFCVTCTDCPNKVIQDSSRCSDCDMGLHSHVKPASPTKKRPAYNRQTTNDYDKETGMVSFSYEIPLEDMQKLYMALTILKSAVETRSPELLEILQCKRQWTDFYTFMEHVMGVDTHA